MEPEPGRPCFSWLQKRINLHQTQSMIRLFILILLLSGNLLAFSQKDSATLKKNIAVKDTSTKEIKLSAAQQQWLTTNYKKIAGLKKDSAAFRVKQNFPTIPEASVEYIISSAAKLLKNDNRQQLTRLKQMLTRLKQQKQALLRKIQDKENQLAQETDPEKRKAITNEILELKKKLKELEDDIQRQEEVIRKMETNS